MSVETLRAAMFNVLNQGAAWAKGAVARKANNLPCAPLNPIAASWDLMGALVKAQAASTEPDFASYHGVYDELRAAIPATYKSRDIEAYNDDVSWTEILGLFPISNTLFNSNEQGVVYEPHIPDDLIQRRNLFDQSSVFTDNFWWQKDGASVATAPTIRTPFPQFGAVAHKFTATNTNPFMYSNWDNDFAGEQRVFSIYMKKADNETPIAWVGFESADVNFEVVDSNMTLAVDLNTGEVRMVENYKFDSAVSLDWFARIPIDPYWYRYKVENVGDGWYRVQIGMISDPRAQRWFYRWGFSTSFATFTDGVVGKGGYIAGAQFEEALVATTYQDITTYTTVEKERILLNENLEKVTMFQDSTGMNPVTQMGQPVGLFLDKRLGLTRGAEKVTNGKFDTNTTGWTGNLGTISAVGGVLRLVGAGDFPSARQSFAVTVGSTYEVTGRIRSVSGAPAVMMARPQGFDTSTGQLQVGATTSTTFIPFRGVVTATTSTLYLRPTINEAASTGTVEFDDISVREIKGNHSIQTTAGSRPLASALQNLFLASDTLATQSVTLVAGIHSLSFTGTGSITMSGAATGTLAGTGANNRVSMTFTPTAGSVTFTVSGSVTLAQLEPGPYVNQYQRVVTGSNYDTIGFPVYLDFDGTSKFLTCTTGGITGTNIVVAAGVLHRAGSGDVYGNKNGNTGYRILVNAVGNDSFAVGNGTAFIAGSHALAANSHGVISGIYNGATTVARVNGYPGTATAVTLTAGAAGFTIGKAHDFSGSFFNGRLYYLAVRGASTPISQVSRLEHIAAIRFGFEHLLDIIPAAFLDSYNQWWQPQIRTGADYAMTKQGNTFIFDLRAGDRPSFDSSSVERSEIFLQNPGPTATTTKPMATQTVITFQGTLTVYNANTAAWCLLTQLHQTEDAGDANASPPFSIFLDSQSRLVVETRSSTANPLVTSPPGVTHYTSPGPVPLGTPIALKWEMKIDYNTAGVGYLKVWRDNVLIVDYTGPIGYNDAAGPYWKAGIYREANANPMVIHWDDLTLT